MPCVRHLHNTYVRWGIVKETTPCQWEAGGAFEHPATDGLVTTPGGKTTEDTTKTGRGTVRGTQVASHWVATSVSGVLRCGYWLDLVLSAICREEWPLVENTIVGTADIDMVTGATLNAADTSLNGTTGWAIQAPTGTFADIIALTDAGHLAYLEMTGWTDPANNRSVRIARAWNTGAVDQLDLVQRYTTNPTAGEFGEAPVAAALESPTLLFGASIRDRIPTDANTQRFSLLTERTDASPGVYSNGYGGIFSTLGINFAGNDKVMLETAMEFTTDDPKVAVLTGGETIVDTPDTDNPYVTANATGLRYFVVGGRYPIAGTLLTGASLTLDVNMSEQEISGTSGRGIINPQGVTGEVNIELDSAPAIELYLDGLTRAEGKGSHEMIDFLISDADGRRYAFLVPTACFNPEGAFTTDGTENAAGTFTPTLAELTEDSRMIVITRITP